MATGPKPFPTRSLRPGLDGVLIPKVDTPEQLEYADAEIRRREQLAISKRSTASGRTSRIWKAPNETRYSCVGWA